MVSYFSKFAEHAKTAYMIRRNARVQGRISLIAIRLFDLKIIVFCCYSQEQEIERTALHSHVGELAAHLKEGDGLREKLKEDVLIKEEELSDLREKTFHLRKLEDQFPILEAQVR